MRIRRGLLLLLLLLVCPLTAAAAPVDDACLAHAGALLDALVHGKFADVDAHFSAKMAAAVVPEKLDEVWQQVTAMRGAYRSHGAVERRVVQSQPAVAAPVQFERDSLYFVSSCDTPAHVDPKVITDIARWMDQVPTAGPVTAGARVEPVTIRGFRFRAPACSTTLPNASPRPSSASPGAGA